MGLLVRKDFGKFRLFMGLTVVSGLVFMVIKSTEYRAKFHHELFPRTSTFLAIYFTLTGLHAIHVLGGMVVNAYLWGPARPCGRPSPCASPTV